WIALAALIVIAAVGVGLWREGRLEPILSPVRNLVAKIESVFPGTSPETGSSAATTAPNDAARGDAAPHLGITQLLAKLDLGPGPMDGTLDPTTEAAIRTYQQMAGVPVTGQPSPGLLRDLRAVVADQSAKGG